MHLNILVVDDDPVVRHILTSILFPEGHNVIVVEDGCGCLKLIEDSIKSKTLPDVVFLDLQLTDMNGTDVFFKLKSLLPHLPIIIISANSKAEALNKHQDLIVEYYLEKPFTKLEVIEVLTCIRQQTNG